MPNARVRIGLLGGARVAAGETVVDRLPTRRLAALLAYLALRPGWEPRERIAEAIWPDQPEGKGLASLRNGLSVLRRVLGPDGGEAPIETTRTDARLVREACECDVWAFWAALARGETGEAARLYAGDLLPDVVDAWLEPYRDELREAFHGALAAETGRLIAAGEAARALPLADRWRASDPYEPEAARRQALGLAASGRVPAAFAALERFDAAARDLFGGSSLDLDAVRREVEAQNVTVPPTPPEPPAYATTSAEPDAGLPLYLSRFFGREEEAAELAGWLASPSTLLTITGMGGIGKTRLAVEAGRAARARGQSVAFIPLAGVDTREGMLAALMAAFELRESEAGTREEALRLHLGGLRRPLVVILDNLEQIVAEAATVVPELLRAGGMLKLLCTSRERLGMEGERVLGLMPLEAEGEAAVRMFVDRARAARADFALTERNRGDVGALCRDLDGLPLAIEIVAAWAGAWSVAQMRANVKDRKVVSRRRGADARHRSLVASIDWSLDLLEAAPREFLLRMSLFRGGWTLEAAEAIANTPAAAETLAALVDRSLVSSGEVDGGIRFSMLESVRSHCRAELAPESVGAVAPRFVAFFSGLAATHTNACAGPQERLNHRSLDRERENFDVAVGFCEEGLVPVEAAAMLAGGLQLHWTYRGQARIGLGLIERVLAVETSEPPGIGVFRAHFARCVLTQEMGDVVGAERSLIALQALAERHDDRDVRFRVPTQLGNFFTQLGRFEEGLEQQRKALDVVVGQGLPKLEAVAECNLAEALFGLNRLDEAIEHWRVAADLDRANGNVAGEAMLYLGFAETVRGNLQEGAKRLLLYLRNVEGLEFGRGYGRAVYYAALVAARLRELDLARNLAASAGAFIAREGYTLEEIERRCFAIVDAACSPAGTETGPIGEAVARAGCFLESVALAPLA